MEFQRSALGSCHPEKANQAETRISRQSWIPRIPSQSPGDVEWGANVKDDTIDSFLTMAAISRPPLDRTKVKPP